MTLSRLLVALCLLPTLAFAQGDVSQDTVTVPGGVARSLADRAAEATNVVDLGADRSGATVSIAAINAAITKAASSGQFSEVRIPAGTYSCDKASGTIVPKSNVVLRGAGYGKTVILVDDTATAGPCVHNATGNNVFTAISDFHLRDLTIKGKGDTNRTAGSHLLQVGNCRNCSVEGVEIRDSRGFGMVWQHSDGLRVRGNRIYRTNGDGIAVWGTSDAIITDNEIIGVNDDAISAHVSDSDPYTARSGLVIANNAITESQGIRVLGAKVVSITGNVMRRMMAHGITVTAAAGTQGNTSPFAVTVRGNVITDVFRRLETPARNADQYYIAISGGPRTAGSGASAPGTPVTATGAVTPLYGGDGVGAFYANGNATPSAVATPGGYWFDVSDNILARSLPAVTAWANWGLGTSLYVGSNGGGVDFTGAVPEANLQTRGIRIGPTLRNSRISGNTVATSGDYAISFDQGVAQSPLDYDGLTIEGNKLRDFSLSGLSLPLNTAQRITVRFNEFDGDPRFVNVNRGPNGTWLTNAGSANKPIGLYLGSTTGVTHYGNSYRNVSEAVNGVANPNLGRNIVYADPVALGFSTGNKGVGVIPDPNLFSFVIEDSDPTSSGFGSVKSQTISVSSAIPASGFYLQGQQITNSQPSISNGQSILSWQRLTTGSGHALGTDWQPVYSGFQGGLWTSYTPTITTSGSGNLASFTANGRYQLVGRRLDLKVNVVLTDIGTATGTLRYTLPANLTTTGGAQCVGVGRENATTGLILQTYTGAGQNIMSISGYDNRPMLANGYNLNVNLSCEVN